MAIWMFPSVDFMEDNFLSPTDETFFSYQISGSLSKFSFITFLSWSHSPTSLESMAMSNLPIDFILQTFPSLLVQPEDSLAIKKEGNELPLPINLYL